MTRLQRFLARIFGGCPSPEEDRLLNGSNEAIGLIRRARQDVAASVAERNRATQILESRTEAFKRAVSGLVKAIDE